MPSLYSPALHGVQLRPKSRHFSCLCSSSLYYALHTEGERGGGLVDRPGAFFWYLLLNCWKWYISWINNMWIFLRVPEGPILFTLHSEQAHRVDRFVCFILIYVIIFQGALKVLILMIDSAVTQSSSVSNTFLIIKYFELFTENTMKESPDLLKNL